MRSFNLKNLLLTGSAMILSGFILIFPIYLISKYLDDAFILTSVAFILLLTTSIYAHNVIRQESFTTLLIKLVLFSLTYLLMVNLFLQYNHFNQHYFQLISAIYFTLLVMTFNNPYIRILTLVTALLFGASFLNTLFRFEGLANNTAYLIGLSGLIVLGLSNYALRFYTLLIALSIALFIGSLSSYMMNYSAIQQSSNFIVLIIICISFLPYLHKNFAKASQYTKLIYSFSLIGLMIALCFLPLSISAGIIMIAIGLYLQSRMLYLLGIILFTSALYFYYYNLALTLNMKGFLLIGMGTAILLIHKLFQCVGRKYS